MKILLVLPPFLRLHGLKLGYFPLGLGYLAAYVEKNGFDVKMYNAELGEEYLRAPKGSIDKDAFKTYINKLEDPNDLIWQEVRSILRNVAPNVVGISVMTTKYGSAKKIAQIAKEVNPSSIVVWGGPHPTIRPEEVLRDANADFAVKGEGEQTFLELLRLFLETGHLQPTALAGIDGLVYHKGDATATTPDRSVIVERAHRPV